MDFSFGWQKKIIGNFVTVWARFLFLGSVLNKYCVVDEVKICKISSCEIRRDNLSEFSGNFVERKWTFVLDFWFDRRKKIIGNFGIFGTRFLFLGNVFNSCCTVDNVWHVWISKAEIEIRYNLKISWTFVNFFKIVHDVDLKLKNCNKFNEKWEGRYIYIYKKNR